MKAKIIAAALLTTFSVSVGAEVFKLPGRWQDRLSTEPLCYQQFPVSFSSQLIFNDIFLNVAIIIQKKPLINQLQINRPGIAIVLLITKGMKAVK